MPYYRSVGEIPPKRHTQFEKPEGGLYAEELMGEEGFSFEELLAQLKDPVGTFYKYSLPASIINRRVNE